MPKHLNSRSQELVSSLIRYFEAERDNNGPLLPLTAVREDPQVKMACPGCNFSIIDLTKLTSSKIHVDYLVDALKEHGIVNVKEGKHTTNSLFFNVHRNHYRTICHSMASWLIWGDKNVISKHHFIKKTWRARFRGICLSAFIKNSVPIGGNNKLVKILEAKVFNNVTNVNVTKSKEYIAEGQLVYCGFEVESKKVFIRPVKNHNEETKKEIFKDWVLPGSSVSVIYLSVMNIEINKRKVNDAGKMMYYILKKLYPPTHERLHAFFEMIVSSLQD